MASLDPRPQRELRPPTTSRPRPRSTLSADHHARLAHRLTPRDRWLIRMLHEHHVLTSTAITTMAFPSGRSARQRLLELHQWHVVDRFQPLIRSGSAPMHYVLGAAGAAVLAAEAGTTVKALGYRRDEVQAVAHRHTLAHTVAINDLFARLVRRSHTAGDLTLTSWWSEARCARQFGDLVRPDAYGRITVAPPTHPHPSSGSTGRARVFEWLFELDFGTEQLARVAGKLDGYAHLAATTNTPLAVLIWLPSARREAGAREHLARALHGLDQTELIRVATTSPDFDLVPADRANDLPGARHEADLADEVWLPLDIRLRVRTRCSLGDLAGRWPAPAVSSVAPFAAPATSARASDLPAPDPIPPVSATFNPALYFSAEHRDPHGPSTPRGQAGEGGR